MAKRKKDDRENFFDVINRNMKEVPGFKALFRLSVYIILIIIFVVVASAGSKYTEEKYSKIDYDALSKKLQELEEQNGNGGSTQTTTGEKEEAKPYHDMIEDLYNKEKTINASISINDQSYKLTMQSKEGILTGLYESSTVTKKFKIQDNKVYETNLDTEKENTTLLSGLNIKYIIPTELANILQNNKSIKTVEEENYIYTYDMNTIKIVTVSTESRILSVDITEGNKIYKLTFE